MIARRLAEIGHPGTVRWLQRRAAGVFYINTSSGQRADGEISELDRKRWHRAQDGHVFEDETSIIVPLSRQLDPIDLSTCDEVIVVDFPSREGLELFTDRLQARQLQHLGQLLATVRQAADDRNATSNLTSLASAANGAGRAADVAYDISRALRQMIGFDGPCFVVRLQSSGRPLEVVSHLSGADSLSPDRTRRKPLTKVAVHIPWTPSIDVSDSSRLRNTVMITNATLSVAGPRFDTKAVSIIAGRVSLAAPVSTSNDTGDLIGEDILRALFDARLVEEGSFLAVPVQSGNVLVGVLVLAARRPNAYTSRDIQLAWSASLLAAHPIGRLDRIENDFTLVGQIIGEAAAIVGRRPVEEENHLIVLLSLLCESLRRALNAASVVILPFDHKADRLVSGSVAHAGAWADVPRTTVVSEDGVLRSILRARTLSWSRDDSPGALHSDSYRARHNIERLKGIVLSSTAGKPIGLLICNWSARAPDISHSPARVSGKRTASDNTDLGQAESLDDKRINEFAAIAGSLLEHQAQSARDARLHDFLFELYGDLLSAATETVFDTPGESGRDRARSFIERIVRNALALVGGTAAAFSVPSFAHDGLDLLVAEGAAQEMEGMRVEYGEGVTGSCALTRTPVIIADSNDPTTFPAGVRPIKRVPLAKSEIAFPVLGGNDQLLGVLDLENTVATGSFDRSDEPILQRLAQAAAISLKLLEHVSYLESLGPLSRSLQQALARGPEDIYRVAVDAIASRTGSYSGSAREYREATQQLVPVVIYGETGSWSAKPIPVEARAAGSQAFREGRRIHIRDVRRINTGITPQREQYLESRPETRSELALPLIAGTRRLGVLNFEHRQPSAFVSSLDYAELIVAQAAATLGQYYDTESSSVSKSLRLVQTLNEFYLAVGHTVAHGYQDIVSEVRRLREDLDVKGRIDPETLAQIQQMAEMGVREASHPLAAATGAYEDERPVNLSSMLLGIVRDFAPADVRLSLRDHKPIRAIAKEQMLRWVVREIISNSLQHGGRAVTVLVDGDLDPRSGRARIVIADDGKGLSDADIDSFFNAKGRSTQTSGSGIAMVGAKVFVDSMHGELEVRSTDPHGLTTTIWLQTGTVT